MTTFGPTILAIPLPSDACWPVPYPMLGSAIATIASSAPADIAFIRDLSSDEARRLLDVRVDQLASQGAITAEEAETLRGAVDADSYLRPAAGSPITIVSMVQHALADASSRDADSHPITTVLAGLGGATVGYVVGGPLGAVIGLMVGAEIAGHDL